MFTNDAVGTDARKALFAFAILAVLGTAVISRRPARVLTAGPVERYWMFGSAEGPAEPPYPPIFPPPPANCWPPCGSRSGACPDFCGAGSACCKLNHGMFGSYGDPWPCPQSMPSFDTHTCTAAASAPPPSPPPPSPPPKLPPSPPPPFPPPPDCWESCGRRAGACPEFCGAGGACCKDGEPWPCPESMPALAIHTCIDAAAAAPPPTLPPPSSPSLPPSSPSPPSPPSLPPRKLDCVEMPKFFEAVAMTQLQGYLETILPTPVTGWERNTLAALTAYRYNNTFLSVKVKTMKLIGCRYEGRESYAWEAFIDGFHDLGYTLTGIDRLDSVRSKYFPDSIRVEVSGIEWTERMLYEVRSLGIYMGGGNVSVAGEGSMWFDDLSIEEEALEKGVGGYGAPIACGGNLTLTKLKLTGPYSYLASYYQSGPGRPDIENYGCYGHEVYTNDLSSGWEYVGPGLEQPGIVGMFHDYMTEACPPGEHLLHPLERCWFIDSWFEALLKGGQGQGLIDGQQLLKDEGIVMPGFIAAPWDFFQTHIEDIWENVDGFGEYIASAGDQSMLYAPLHDALVDDEMVDILDSISSAAERKDRRQGIFTRGDLDAGLNDGQKTCLRWALIFWQLKEEGRPLSSIESAETAELLLLASVRCGLALELEDGAAADAPG